MASLDDRFSLLEKDICNQQSVIHVDGLLVSLATYIYDYNNHIVMFCLVACFSIYKDSVCTTCNNLVSEVHMVAMFSHYSQHLM